MQRLDAAAGFATALMALAPLGGCKHGDHPHVASFVRPPLPAGFAEQAGRSWRLVTPATWHDPQRGEPRVWSLVDPQPVDDFRASVNVVTEPFVGESYAYAKANVEELQHDPRASVETTREDVIDGDPTLVVQSRWSAIAPANVPYRTMQANLASRGTGYVVTCSVSADAFERYRSTCEAIVHSFAVER
jgi:hypothetical protein